MNDLPESWLLAAMDRADGDARRLARVRAIEVAMPAAARALRRRILRDGTYYRQVGLLAGGPAVKRDERRDVALAATRAARALDELGHAYWRLLVATDGRAGVRHPDEGFVDGDGI